MQRWLSGRRAALAAARNDEGMSTAEYAIGVLSACSFAAVLMKILTGDHVKELVSGLIERALTSLF
jgi:hypothetical protein